MTTELSWYRTSFTLCWKRLSLNEILDIRCLWDNYPYERISEQINNPSVAENEVCSGTPLTRETWFWVMEVVEMKQSYLLRFEKYDIRIKSWEVWVNHFEDLVARLKYGRIIDDVEDECDEDIDLDDCWDGQSVICERIISVCTKDDVIHVRCAIISFKIEQWLMIWIRSRFVCVSYQQSVFATQDLIISASDHSWFKYPVEMNGSYLVTTGTEFCDVSRLRKDWTVSKGL